MRALTWEEFEGYEGAAAWQVDSEGGPSVEMTLKRAVQLPSSGRAAGSFRLEFQGPSEPILPQAIYRFRSGDACHDIFIVPVARDDDGTLYEAVFN
jgi:hypothetical protein